MAEENPPPPKPVHWVGSSRDDVRDFPAEVTRADYEQWLKENANDSKTND